MMEKHVIAKKSILSGKEHSLEMTFDMADYVKWQTGALIQNAMPYLTLDEREFLISGITEEEWRMSFEDEENPGKTIIDIKALTGTK